MNFLEYATKLAQALGGATGAQGEAPKFVVAEGPDDEFMLMACSSGLVGERDWLGEVCRAKGY